MIIAGRAFALTAVVFASLPAPSSRAEPISVGVVAPLTGSFAPLGNQVLAGANAAAKTEGVSVEAADDTCSAAGGKQAADTLVAAKVQAVVGFLCIDAIEAAMPVFKQAGVPVITVGVRADALTDSRLRTGWPVVRLAPRADSESEAVGRFLSDLWRGELFAIVDDGTIYGRELAESLRATAEGESLKPVFTDTFRPGSENQIALVERLAKAGATHVFVGGDREDIAVMTRDAAARGIGLVFAGGEALRADPGPVTLAEGTLMVGPPEWAETADPAAVAAIRAGNAQPEGYALPAYAAVEIVSKEWKGDTGLPASKRFLGRTYGTAIGPVALDGAGDLAQNPFRLFRFDGTQFVPLENP